jgi:hypothetical protein
LEPSSIAFWIGSGIILLVSISTFRSLVAKTMKNEKVMQKMQLSTKELKKELDELPVSLTQNRVRRAWRGYRRFILEKKVPEAQNICSFYLRPLDDKPLPPFEPGQHLGFQLRIPGHKRPTVRNYSLSSSSKERSKYKITVKKIPPPPDQQDLPSGAGSTFLHENLSVGDLLEVSSPAGKFVLDRQDPRPAVFLAGGIGITPLLSMLETICDEKIERKCYFIHAVRNRSEQAFREHIQKIVKKCINVELHVFYSHPAEDEEVESTDHGQHVGYIDVDCLAKITGGGDLQYYICGPPPMMQTLVPALEGFGVSSDSILMEAFGPASTRAKSAKVTTDSGEESTTPQQHKLHFKLSNRILTWDGTSPILDMAEEVGIFIDSSCRSGNCGTCEIRLHDGEVEYEEEPGIDITPGHCLACVAKPVTEVNLGA